MRIVAMAIVPHTYGVLLVCRVGLTEVFHPFVPFQVVPSKFRPPRWPPTTARRRRRFDGLLFLGGGGLISSGVVLSHNFQTLCFSKAICTFIRRVGGLVHVKKIISTKLSVTTLSEQRTRTDTLSHHASVCYCTHFFLVIGLSSIISCSHTDSHCHSVTRTLLNICIWHTISILIPRRAKAKARPLPPSCL